MDQNELQKLIYEAPSDELIDSLLTLTEKERRSLSVFTYKLYSTIQRQSIIALRSSNVVKDVIQNIKGRFDAKAPSPPDVYYNSSLAVFILCPLSRTKKVKFWQIYYDKEIRRQIDKIVRTLKPKWLSAWIEHELSQEFASMDWVLLRGWMKDGLCDVAISEGYIQFFVIGLLTWQDDSKKNYIPVNQALINDPELLSNEVWQLFYFQTSAFAEGWHKTSNNALQNYQDWPESLLDLSNKGILDRARLLDESLNALSRDFEPRFKSGFYKFHLFLDPSLEELDERKSKYIDLLSDPVGHVVTFALKMIRKLENAGRLAAHDLIDSFPSVLSLPGKGQAKTYLQILRRLYKNNDLAKHSLVPLCVDAIIHDSSDIQEIILSILEELKEYSVSAFEGIERYQDIVHPSLRHRLLSLSPESVETTTSEVDFASEWNVLKKTIEDISSEKRALLGLDAYLGEIFPTEIPPPLNIPFQSLRLLDGLERIKPIETFDELLKAVSHAVEIVDSADEVERILDGICRLCDRRPADFALKTEALLKRIYNPTYSEASRGLISGYGGLCIVLKDLLKTWITSKPAKANQLIYKNANVHVFMDLRIREMIPRIAKRHATISLSAPTHLNGWIEAHILVERILHLQSKNEAIPRYDLLQALLRIAPDNRDSALINAQEIDGGIGRALRWALGGKEGPNSRDRLLRDVWLVADRARNPLGDSTIELANLGVKKCLPDVLVPAGYSWRSRMEKQEVYDSIHIHPVIEIRTTPLSDYRKNENKNGVISSLLTLFNQGISALPPKGLAANKLPTFLLTKTSSRKWFWDSYLNYSGSWLIQWAMQTWPANLDGSLKNATYFFVSRVNDNANTFQPNYAFLAPIFNSVLPWTEMTYVAVAIALISKDADSSGHAVDLMIESIEDSRMHPAKMSETLIKLARGGWMKTNRLADRLSQISQVSQLHSLVCFMMLDTFLEAQEKFPRNSHLLFDCILSSCIELNVSPSDNLLAKLKKVTGASKKAKLAKSIIALADESSMSLTNRHKAILAAIKARIDLTDRVV
ncbi:MAG: DUF6493 family protein [Calditrichia bacterium]